jgi:hypothetical protein
MVKLLVRNPELLNDSNGYHILTFEASLDGGATWLGASVHHQPQPTLAHNGICWLGLETLPKLRIRHRQSGVDSELEGCTTSPEVFELQNFLGAYCNQSAVCLPSGPIDRNSPQFKQLVARGQELLERSPSHTLLRLDSIEEIVS